MDADLEKLVEEYYPIAKRIVGKIVNRMPEGFEESDFIQIGMMGLLKAFENWDEKKSNEEFKSYAMLKIKGAVLDKLRAIDPISRYARDKLKLIAQAFHGFLKEGRYNPTDDEVAHRADINVDTFNKLMMEISNATIYSIDDATENTMPLIDTIKNNRVKDPLSATEDLEIIEIIKESLKKLERTELIVLSLYYYEDFTMKEISHIIKKTESRVSQIKTKALIKLKIYVKERFTYGN